MDGVRNTPCIDVDSGTYWTCTGCHYNSDRSPAVLQSLGWLVGKRVCRAVVAWNLAAIQLLGDWDLLGSTGRHRSCSDSGGSEESIWPCP